MEKKVYLNNRKILLYNTFNNLFLKKKLKEYKDQYLFKMNNESLKTNNSNLKKIKKKYKKKTKEIKYLNKKFFNFKFITKNILEKIIKPKIISKLALLSKKELMEKKKNKIENVKNSVFKNFIYINIKKKKEKKISNIEKNREKNNTYNLFARILNKIKIKNMEKKNLRKIKGVPNYERIRMYKLFYNNKKKNKNIKLKGGLKLLKIKGLFHDIKLNNYWIKNILYDESSWFNKFFKNNYLLKNNVELIIDLLQIIDLSFKMLYKYSFKNFLYSKNSFLYKGIFTKNLKIIILKIIIIRQPQLRKKNRFNLFFLRILRRVKNVCLFFCIFFKFYKNIKSFFFFYIIILL